MGSESAGDKLLVRRVDKVYGETAALRDVSFAVRAGEFVALIGPSGCGKSTLLMLIAGFEPPTRGEIQVDGVPVQGPAPGRAVLFQEPLLFPWLSVRANVLFGPRARADRSGDVEERARRWLEQVGLAGFAGHYPHQLSGGMKQRAALARVLINDPEFLLMDEPFAALDAQTRFQMQQLLLRVWQETGKTVLFVTHDVDEALLLADRIIVLSRRPGTVLDQFPVPLPRPRHDALSASPDYIELKRRIWAALQ